MKIKHIIIIRFLNSEMKLENILEDNIIEYRLNLLQKYSLKSLENQTNHNFSVIILINKKLKEKYRKAILNNKYPFEVKLLETKTPNDVDISKFKDDYNFIITSRLDDDDMIYKNAIKDIHNSIEENTVFKVFGFKNGVTKIINQKGFYEFKPSYGNNGMLAILKTLIVNCKICKRVPNIYTLGDHTKTKENINKNYKSLFNIDEMPNDYWHFDTHTNPAWIYTRHNLNDSKGRHRTDIEVEESIIKKMFGEIN